VHVVEVRQIEEDFALEQLDAATGVGGECVSMGLEIDLGVFAWESWGSRRSEPVCGHGKPEARARPRCRKRPTWADRSGGSISIVSKERAAADNGGPRRQRQFITQQVSTLAVCDWRTLVGAADLLDREVEIEP
jgi:hypothetical protein